MKNKLIVNKLIVKKSIIHGYGVFAADNIRSGDIIEECYTIQTKVDDPAWSNYYFKGSKDHYATPLGFGCIYNHSDQPNATYSYDEVNQIMVFEATRFIHKGEEILTSYGKNWFERRNFIKKQNAQKNSVLLLILRICIAVGSVYLIITALKASLTL